MSRARNACQNRRRLDREHVQQVVDLHRRAVFAYVRPRVLQGGDADDMVQEVFVRYCEAGRSFDGPTDQRRWLIGIARNVLREHVRKRRGRREVAWSELCLDLDRSTPDGPVRDAEYLQQLPQCLEELGPSARQALEWHYADRLPIRTIAEKLKRSEGAVKLLMYRARQALKHRLERRVREAATRRLVRALHNGDEPRRHPDRERTLSPIG